MQPWNKFSNQIWYHPHNHEESPNSTTLNSTIKQKDDLFHLPWNEGSTCWMTNSSLMAPTMSKQSKLSWCGPRQAHRGTSFQSIRRLRCLAQGNVYNSKAQLNMENTREAHEFTYLTQAQIGLRILNYFMIRIIKHPC